MAALDHYFDTRKHKGYDYDVHQNKYQLSVRIPIKDDSELIGEVKIKINILEYDKSTSCIEFKKIEGDQFAFIRAFEKFVKKFTYDDDY